MYATSPATTTVARRVHETCCGLPCLHRASAGGGDRNSINGQGRGMDNIFAERLRRSLKYEAAYLHEIADGFTA